MENLDSRRYDNYTNIVIYFDKFDLIFAIIGQVRHFLISIFLQIKNIKNIKIMNSKGVHRHKKKCEQRELSEARLRRSSSCLLPKC